MRGAIFRLLAAALTVGAVAIPAAADEPLPIVDTHVHYGTNDWPRYSAASVLALFDAANVPRALVSSTPDDGTLILHRAAPARIVPILRPYRSGVGSGNWTEDAATPAYLEARLASGVYRGIGEFHLFNPNAVATPMMRRVIALARARDLILHVHSGAEPVRRLFAAEPGLHILWAHAGMSEPAEVVREMVEGYPNLLVELSFRAGDVAPGGILAPVWRALIEAHAERFMIGSDTYRTFRWDQYAEIIAQHRRWLEQLPRPVAEAVAFRNADRYFPATP